MRTFHEVGEARDPKAPGETAGVVGSVSIKAQPGDWEPYLRGVAQRAGMEFLGVGHCAPVTSRNPSVCPKPQ
jgi:hypothetical protein